MSVGAMVSGGWRSFGTRVIFAAAATWSRTTCSLAAGTTWLWVGGADSAAMVTDRTRTVARTRATPAMTLVLVGSRQWRIGFSTTWYVAMERSTAITTRIRLSPTGRLLLPTCSAAMIRIGQCQR